MNENNPLESYEQELKDQKSILDNLNKNLKELMNEKEKINKYEYAERYNKEEEKINRYITKTQKKISKLEQIITAYHSIEEVNKKLNQLESIFPRNNQEKEEITMEKEYLEAMKNKNIEVLPEEIKVLFSSNNLSTGNKKEQTTSIFASKNNQIKGIDEYRKEIEENEQEIKHLRENIEKLISIKDSIPIQEYERDLETLKRYKNRETGKLLRNRQVVTAYELIENNQERISYLNHLIARDEQDAREIKEELDFLTKENDYNKRFVPKTLYKNLISPNSEYSFESRTTPESIVEEGLSENEVLNNIHQNSTEIEQNEKNLSEEENVYFDDEATREELENYYNEILKRIQKENGKIKNKPLSESIIQEEIVDEKETPKIDFSNSQELFKKLKNLYFKIQEDPSLIKLTTTLKDALSEEKSNNQPEIVSSQTNNSNPFNGINDSKIEVVEPKIDYTADNIISAYFSNPKKEEISVANSDKKSAEGTGSSNPKDQAKNSPQQESELPIIVEQPKTENSVANSGKKSAEGTGSSNSKEKEEKSSQATNVNGVRESKKKMKEKMIRAIATIATALVILSTGSGINNKIKKSKPSPTVSPIENTKVRKESGTTLGNNDIEIFDDGNQNYIITDSTKVPEIIIEENEETEKQDEESTQKVTGYQVSANQAIPQPVPELNEGLEILIELDDLMNQQINNDFSKTVEVTDGDVLENAFINSGLAERVTEDEYSAAQGNWDGVKEENIQYWIDNPLRFTEDEKTGSYLMEQQDENGNWVGMGWTDAESANQYLQNLESYENQTGKGRH